MGTHKTTTKYRRFALRNWRVRSRLTALIVAPTLVALLLAGVRMAASADSLDGYARITSGAEYSVDLRNLARELGLERDLTVWGGSSQRTYNVDGKTELTIDGQRAVVDKLTLRVSADLKKIDSGYGVRAAAAAQKAAIRIAGLPSIREARSAANYSPVIAILLSLHDELGQNSDVPEIVGDTRALSALAHTSEEASLQRAMLTKELVERRQSFYPSELRDFIASQSRQRNYIDAFIGEARSADSNFLLTLLGDKDVVDAELTKWRAVAVASQSVSIGSSPVAQPTPAIWFQQSTKGIQQMAIVGQRMSASALDRARDLQSAEQRSVLITGGLILALLLLVIGTTVIIARSMVRPLRRLRSEALEIAGTRLPEVVRWMRESADPNHAAPPVQPIGVGSHDEIGEVAKAFDEVHMQAVHLAAEESRLRSNVNAIFVNLSRRTQTLVERQISLIDGLERGEQDGTRLADLFTLDHLATRMRRNSENLLVLAGHEPPRKRNQPAQLVDVVRASLSEVEDYERVTLRLRRGAAVAGNATNDVVHLVAELVENAIAFSPPYSKVLVSSTPIDGGAVLLAVSDAGMGMQPEQLMEINQRLAEPPAVDVSVSRQMGLFVVGRLALRHGIRVQLRKGDAGGLIAMVFLPAGLITNPDSQANPDIPAVRGQQMPPAIDPAPGSRASEDPPSTRLPTRKPSAQRATPGSFTAFSAPDRETTGGFQGITEHPVTSGPPVDQGPSGPYRSPAMDTTDTQFTFGRHSGAFQSTGVGKGETGPQPAGSEAPLERGDEFLPIFADIESGWFRRPTASELAAVSATAFTTSEVPESPTRSTTSEESQMLQESGGSADGRPEMPAGGIWRSSADGGFEAAAAAGNDPARGGVTSAGLPKRTPKANLVPGSVDVARAPVTPPRPPVSPDQMRSRLADFQQGVRRGRADAVGDSVEESGIAEGSS